MRISHSFTLRGSLAAGAVACACSGAQKLAVSATSAAVRHGWGFVTGSQRAKAFIGPIKATRKGKASVMAVQRPVAS